MPDPLRLTVVASQVRQLYAAALCGPMRQSALPEEVSVCRIGEGDAVPVLTATVRDLFTGTRR